MKVQITLQKRLIRMLSAFAVPFVLNGFAQPAQADLQVCNDTKALVGVSIGFSKNKKWITEGWWRIPASVCTSVIEGKLDTRYFYLHAEEADSGGRWRGPHFMCTSNKQFKINGTKDCFARGYEQTGFFEVDTGNQENWQVRLTESDRDESKKQ
ncbi:MAG: DUF1036 domain-containing protein [Rhizobiaceae bacterium]